MIMNFEGFYGTLESKAYHSKFICFAIVPKCGLLILSSIKRFQGLLGQMAEFRNGTGNVQD